MGSKKVMGLVLGYISKYWNFFWWKIEYEELVLFKNLYEFLVFLPDKIMRKHLS